MQPPQKQHQQRFDRHLDMFVIHIMSHNAAANEYKWKEKVYIYNIILYVYHIVKMYMRSNLSEPIENANAGNAELVMIICHY